MTAQAQNHPTPSILLAKTTVTDAMKICPFFKKWLLVARPTNSTFVLKIGRKSTPLFPKILRNLFGRIFSLCYSLNDSCLGSWVECVLIGIFIKINIFVLDR